ncbi:hypothetical protein Tco_0143974 [Tanacetum coccineum]
METKNTSSSGSDLEEPEIQKLQMQAKNLKENSLNKLNALKTTIQHLSSSNHSMYYEFREAFHRLFDANEGLFRSVLSRNMQNLEMQFSNETLHEKDSNSELHFNANTTMELQPTRNKIQNMTPLHNVWLKEQELKMTLKRLNESQVQIQECTVQKVQSSVTSSGDETSSGIVSEEEIDKKELEAHYGFMAKIQEVLPAESSSTDTPLEQDLKAQMQDKNIAISELKKLIENCKGKSVETQFDKPSIVRQPNAQRIPKPSVLGKPTPFSDSPEMRSSNDMVHNYYLEKAKKSAQLQKDKDVKGKPSMIDPARLPNTANGCKPKLRNWQESMSSRVSKKDVHLGEHRKQKPFLKFNDLQCPTCKKCLYSANHDECVLEYLSRYSIFSTWKNI